MRAVDVVVAGDLMLDRYISGAVSRISPEAPVPVVRVEKEAHAVGGAANVAANVVALGARCRVVGCVGSDEAGRVLRGALEDLGVDTGGIVETPDRPTTVKTRVLARRQQVVRYDREDDGDVEGVVEEALAAAVEAEAGGAGALVFQDYNKGVLVPRVIEAGFRAAGASGIPTVADPKWHRFLAYAGVTVFKPNAKELLEALGAPLLPDDRAWMEETRRRIGCRHLLLTLGDQGMSLITEAGEHLRIPTVARDVYDVSGAGDTVTSVVAISLAAGATPEEAAILANHAAAIEVGKAGVATVGPDEILEHCRVLRDP